MNTIPSIDLRDFLSSDKNKRNAFIKELGVAYENIGFAAVKGHFLNSSLSDRLYSLSKSFFNLPLDVKLKYSDPDLAGQRGYTGWGKEHAKGSSVGDLKEFWHFGQLVPDELKTEFNYPDNLLVEELPEFNEVGMEAFKALEDTGRFMLRAMALYLDLDEFYFDREIQYGNSILRPIHYAPITQEPPAGAVRAGAHEDINLITLLMGASAEGLEILTKKGHWVPVTAVEDHLVVNVGDMLQRLTNDRFKSTTHRVVNPPREKWEQPRYSIPFFLHPKSETRLDCLDSCIDGKHPKKYQNISAGEYLNQRLKEIGLLK
ncbi:MAG: isopenicillin N synthase family oxygenase [Bacteroidetes bacterium]|nr:isopenicillin N synthase family oxygenase [Bacteroidota bacterium]